MKRALVWMAQAAGIVALAVIVLAGLVVIIGIIVGVAGAIPAH